MYLNNFGSWSISASKGQVLAVYVFYLVNQNYLKKIVNFSLFNIITDKCEQFGIELHKLRGR